MRTSAFFLANFAEKRGGLANILGAFPEWWNVPSVPIRVAIGFVLVQELDEDEMDAEFEIHLRLCGPTVHPDAPLGIIRALPRRSTPTEPGAPARNLIAHIFPVEFTEFGFHRFEAHSWDQSNPGQPFDVVTTSLFVRLGPLESG